MDDTHVLMIHKLATLVGPRWEVRLSCLMEFSYARFSSEKDAKEWAEKESLGFRGKDAGIDR